MITERIFSSPKSTSVSIVYDTVIALGLAACNASAETDAFNFTGKDHYDTVLGKFLYKLADKLKFQKLDP
jgi:hypothetical protein